MPYKTIDDLPEGVKGLPVKAQEIYLAAFNSAYEQYKSDGAAAAIAWSAVKRKFEKKGDKWVAKEASMSELLLPYGRGLLGDKVRDNLRKAYAEIIQEYGKRNAAKDEARIRKIIQLACELLSEEEVTEAGNIDFIINAWKDWAGSYTDCVEALSGKPGITDPESLCAWLHYKAEGKWPGEKESGKTDFDNKTLLAMKEQVLTLALKEADSVLTLLKGLELVKTEEGKKYPKEAYAYAPGEDVTQWKLRLWETPELKVTKNQLNKASAYLSPGGYKGDKISIPVDLIESVKRKVRTEYRKLGVEDEEIPRWVSEVESRTLLLDYVSLAESKVSSKGIAEVVILKPGFNTSKERYYPPEVIVRDFGVFEGVKMYADHPTTEEDKNRPERSIKDWVANLKNVRVNKEGQAVGDAIIIEPWMQEKLATLRDKGLLSEMGVSINAVGQASKQTIEGVKTNFIEKIVRARSIDFVTEAGAGGLVQMYESSPEYDVDIVSLETLKERRPDIIKIIEAEAKAEALQEVKKKMELEEKIKLLEEQIATLTVERDALKSQITEAEKAKAIAETKVKLDEALVKSELPEPAKVRILESFKEAQSVEGLEEAIKIEKEYIASLTEAGKVKHMGGSQPDSKAAKEALKESFKKLHPEYSEEQLRIATEGK
ncbi:MAG: putative cation transport regulator ChaB [candidate division WS2 bacterium]|nr:putative cation transport regulator ChaB [Candidatus Lithacetigena glycinireducens]